MSVPITDAPVASNQQKYENYKEQFRRLNRALFGGFNLEAIFIAYTIMEDRTESALRHAGLYDVYVASRKGRQVSIDSKIKYIQKQAEAKKSIAHKYFSDSLLDDILAWKEERNRLIHALLKQHLTDEDIQSCANRGVELVKTLRNRVSSFNRAVEKAKTLALSSHQGVTNEH